MDLDEGAGQEAEKTSLMPEESPTTVKTVIPGLDSDSGIETMDTDDAPQPSIPVESRGSEIIVDKHLLNLNLCPTQGDLNPSKMVEFVASIFRVASSQEAAERSNSTYGTKTLQGVGRLLPLSPFVYNPSVARVMNGYLQEHGRSQESASEATAFKASPKDLAQNIMCAMLEWLAEDGTDPAESMADGKLIICIFLPFQSSSRPTRLSSNDVHRRRSPRTEAAGPMERFTRTRRIPAVADVRRRPRYVSGSLGLAARGC